MVNNYELTDDEAIKFIKMIDNWDLSFHVGGGLLMGNCEGYTVYAHEGGRFSIEEGNVTLKKGNLEIINEIYSSAENEWRSKMWEEKNSKVSGLKKLLSENQ